MSVEFIILSELPVQEITRRLYTDSGTTSSPQEAESDFNTSCFEAKNFVSLQCNRRQSVWIAFFHGFYPRISVQKGVLQVGGKKKIPY